MSAASAVRTIVEAERDLRCQGCHKLLGVASVDGRAALKIVCPRCRRFNLLYLSDLGALGVA